MAQRIGQNLCNTFGGCGNRALSLGTKEELDVLKINAKSYRKKFPANKKVPLKMADNSLSDGEDKKNKESI